MSQLSVEQKLNLLNLAFQIEGSNRPQQDPRVNLAIVENNYVRLVALIELPENMLDLEIKNEHKQHDESTI